MLSLEQIVKGSVFLCLPGKDQVLRQLVLVILWSASWISPAMAKDVAPQAKDRAAIDSTGANSEQADANGGGPEFTKWERIVRGFRREHHFALTSGYGVGSWQVGTFGNLRSLQVGDSGFWGRAEYTYHLQLYRGLGYFLGSSVGVSYTKTRDSAPVKPPTSLIYPGVVAGGIYNFSPRFRVFGAASINLERYDDLRGINPDEDGVAVAPTEISITMESYDGMIGLDFFPALQFAIRVEFHDRYQFYRKPREASDKPVDADLERFDRWLGAGLVYHLL